KADTVPINRVGTIYLRLSHIFSPPGNDPEPHLSDDNFLSDVSAHQAYYADWGNGESVLIPAVRNRQEALAAIEALAEQGEGLFDSTAAPSHYQRFLAIYKEFPEDEGDWQPAYPVPRNPNTSPATHHGQDPEEDIGRI